MDETKLTKEQVTILREMENELILIIESYAVLVQSQEWNTIKTLVYGKSIASIEAQIKSESLKPVIDTNKLYKLQGEWEVAKRYSDPSRYIENLKRQLAELKLTLKNNE